MTPTDGYRKATPAVKTMSVREAVSKYGDYWRRHVGKGYAIGCDLVTFDCLEKVSMDMMERGIAPRIRALDL